GLVRYRVVRRLHPVQRLGWYTARRSSSTMQTLVGVGLFGLGLILKRQARDARLYSTKLDRGERVRIIVHHGASVIGDTVVET
ncbi:MAG: hypothetical protein KDB69_00555, partial [Acidimicrobiia bacterium]|nr:hypothetical protein [Acidimicrobiia bacterium]